MFMPQNLFQKTLKEPQTSSKEAVVDSVCIESKTIDPSRPDRAELLQTILASNDIWDLKDRKFTSKKSKNIFNEIFFGLFVAWMTKNFNFPYQGNFCFVGLDNKNSLIVLPPIDKTTAFINSYGGGLKIFKKDIFDPLDLEKIKTCPICLIKHYVLLNVNQIPTKDDCLLELSHLNHGHDKCDQHTVENLKDELSQKIIANPNFSVLTGGFGLELKCPTTLISEICEKYFAEFEDQKDLSSIVDDLFLAAILVHLTSNYGFGKFATNQSVKLEKGSPGTPELDGVAYTKRDPSNAKLLVLELTALFDTAFHKSLTDTSEKQFPKHFKDKVRIFNDLDYATNKNNFKFNFTYIHLKAFDEEMLKSLEYSAVKNNKSYKSICLEEDFLSLKSLIKAEEFTNGRLYHQFRKSYSKLKSLLEGIDELK